MDNLVPNMRDHLGLLACRHGVMLYFKYDTGVGSQLHFYGEYFEGEVTLFSRLVGPGMLIVEAGANIGCHTVPLAKLTGNKGQVLAFEPQRMIFQILNANVALNGLENVQTYQQGLGKEPGNLRAPVMDYTKYSNIGGVQLNMDRGESVLVTRLDDYNLERLDFLKIDVEGMELAVLQGADKSIAAYRPMLYIENDKLEPGKSESLNQYILDLGYKVWWHLTPAFDRQNYFNNQENNFPIGVSSNMLCLPKEIGASINLPEMTDPNETWLHVFERYSQKSSQTTV